MQHAGFTVQRRGVPQRRVLAQQFAQRTDVARLGRREEILCERSAPQRLWKKPTERLRAGTADARRRVVARTDVSHWRASIGLFAATTMRRPSCAMLVPKLSATEPLAVSGTALGSSSVPA